MRATCKALDARLLVVDSLAGAYGGDENVRALVRAFCADWDKWATNARCAVMLIVGEHCFHEAQLRRRVFRMRLHT